MGTADYSKFSPSQRAAIAAEIASELKQNAEKQRGLTTTAGSPFKGGLVAFAAALVGAEKSAVERAMRVRRENSDLFQQIKDGKMFVSAAHRQLGPAKPGYHRGHHQHVGRHGLRRYKTEPFLLKTPHQRVRALTEKNRLLRTVSVMEGFSRGLSDLDLPMVLSVCASNEIQEWAEAINETVNGLRSLVSKLKKSAKHIPITETFEGEREGEN